MKRTLARLLFGVMLASIALSPAALTEAADTPAEALLPPEFLIEAAAEPEDAATGDPDETPAEAPADEAGTEAAAEPDVELVLDTVEPDVDEVSFDLVEEELALEPAEEEAVSNPAMFGDVPEEGEDSIKIDEAHFPDEVLQHIILDKAIDQDENGSLSRQEIEAVTEISIAYEETDGEHTVQHVAESLAGINIFPNLNNLDCRGVNATTLTLDIRGCKELGNIDLYYTKITNLTILTDREELKLPCEGCDIGTLTVNGGNNLVDLWIERNMHANQGDENGGSQFEPEENDENRPKVTTLDVKACTGLRSLICKETQTESMDFSGCSQLVRLDCTGNNLSAVDVTGKTALEELHICGNDKNKPLNLDLSDCGNLRVLKCEGSKISALNVSNCPSLVYLLQNVPKTTENDGNVTVYALGDWNRLSFTGEVTLTPELNPDLPSPVIIDETSFPNVNFRQYILDRFHKAEGDSLSSNEIAFTTEITLCPENGGYKENGYRWQTNEDGSPKGMGITSLKGIEVFKNLQVLNCLGNKLEGEGSFNLASFALLTELNCSDCGLATLDVSNNPNLETLACSGNSLTELNLANNPRLNCLIADSNPIASLDVTPCPALDAIVNKENREVNVDWEEGFVLVEFWGRDAMIFHDLETKLIGTQATFTPRKLSINDTFKDLGLQNYVLKHFDGTFGADEDGYLSEREILNIEPNCFIDCGRISEEDPKIQNLNDLVNFKGIKDLCVSGITSFTNRSLDLSNMPWLTSVWVDGCNLTSLNVSGNSELQELFCQCNLLTTLDITGCHEKLRNCVNGANYALVEDDSEVVYRYIRTDEETGKEYEEEHLRCDADVTIIGGNPKPPLSGVPLDEAHFPDIKLRQYLSDIFDGMFGDEKDNKLSVREISEVYNIDLHEYKKENGDLNYDENGELVFDEDKPLGVETLKGIGVFTNLIRLECGDNPVKSLDLSTLRKLRYLHCYLCELGTLDISHNPELEMLDCFGNNLTQLYVSNNPKLYSLNCFTNNITELDISHCPVLVEKTDLANTTPTRHDSKPGAEDEYHVISYDYTVQEVWEEEDGPHTRDLYCSFAYDADVKVTGLRDSRPKPAPAPAPAPVVPVIPAIKKASKTTIPAAPGTTAQLDLGGASGKAFKSSNKKVATVDQSGLVTFKNAGKVKITFKVGQKKRTVTLVVKDPTIPTSVRITAAGPLSGKRGETLQLTAVLPPKTDSPIKWTSSNKKVATVSSTGLVTFKKPGKAKITATAKRGRKKAKITVQSTK